MFWKFKYNLIKVFPSSAKLGIHGHFLVYQNGFGNTKVKYKGYYEEIQESFKEYGEAMNYALKKKQDYKKNEDIAL